MKERPILFNGDMVRAILAGRKTQTRRIMNPQPIENEHGGFNLPNYFAGSEKTFREGALNFIGCKLGKPGDRLWVKETHLNWWKLNPNDPSGKRIFSHVAAYKADGYELEQGEKWIPSIHMLRESSRINLEITNVRVERLQDIGEDDAIAEGANEWFETGPFNGRESKTFCAGYRRIWESIYDQRSWDKNPWVWVIEFKRV